MRFDIRQWRTGHSEFLKTGVHPTFSGWQEWRWAKWCYAYTKMAIFHFYEQALRVIVVRVVIINAVIVILVVVVLCLDFINQEKAKA